MDGRRGNSQESSELLQIGALAATALALTAGFMVLRLLYGLVILDGIVPSLAKAVFFFLGVFVLPLTVSYGFRRSWRLAVRIAGACLIFGLVWTAMRNEHRIALDQRKSTQEVLDASATFKSEIASDAKSQIESTGFYHPDTEALEARVGALKDKTSKLSGRGAMLAEASFSLAQAVIEAGRATSEVGKRFIEARVLDPRTIETVEDIQKRRELTEEYRQANEQLLEYLDHLEENAHKVLDGKGLTPQEVTALVAQLVHSPNIQLARRMRLLDKTIAENSIGILNLLEKNWGSWRMRNDKVIFTDPSVLEPYNTLFHGAQDAAKQEAEVQKELVEQMKH